MKRRIIFFLSLSLLLGLSGGIFWLTNQDGVSAKSSEPRVNPLEVFNQKAKKAKDGDLSSAEDLVDNVISITGFENELHGFTEDRIKDRVGRAESRYRQGQTEGIPEAKVARTVNGLVKQFNLPKYAKTNLYEVRKLRVGLFPNFPQIITLRSKNVRSASAPTEVESKMSPAEAVFVLSMMIQQKLGNEDYQLTHEERVKNWKESQSRHSDKNNQSKVTQGRSRELREAIRRGVSDSSLSDAWHLSDITLNTLGIEQ